VTGGPPISPQDPEGVLEEILSQQRIVATMLDRAMSLDLPDWYLGAGCITQTVWNALHGYDLTFGIKDYDLIYFDAEDLSEEAERAVEGRAIELMSDLAAKVDVTNEARVHRWYEERFRRAIDPYQSSADAIATWPTTASSVGVRRRSGTLEVCAPFGLEDLFLMIVRPNKRQVSREVYEAKAMRWGEKWPRLTVLSW
jgi:hypothetical protein